MDEKEDFDQADRVIDAESKLRSDGDLMMMNWC
jgi:hypothetical protein